MNPASVSEMFLFFYFLGFFLVPPLVGVAAVLL
jgi:hypothetical protein